MSCRSRLRRSAVPYWVFGSLVPPVPFTPAELFEGGQAGFWPGSFDPAGVGLWQEAAGTTPAMLPGDPVGKSDSEAGPVDASQAVALSRPTLARWPKGGQRNLLTWSENISNAAWHITGVGVEKVGQQGVSFLEGYPASRVYYPLYLPSAGKEYTFYADLSGYGDVRMYLVGPDGSTGSPTTISLTSVPTRYSVTRIMAPGPFQAGPSIYGGPAGGAATCVIHGAQLEVGPSATPYQRVTTANDTTEAGVPDVWHLWNDGGDSLNAAPLPAGTYGLAYVDTLGGVTVSTETSDGTAPIDVLRTERQADVILRQGAFTAEEEAEIRAYWGGLYA